ncbi:MAG: rod shape-determining protein RodA [Gammaproteobacteria bacterium]
MDRTSNILFRFHIDLPLFGGVVVMCALGLVVLYSASDQSTDIVFKQVARILIGFIVMIAMAQVPPRRLARWALALYVIGLALLGLVLIVGIGRGAQRWLDFGVLRFQPSELMKLAVPLTVASFLADKVLPPSLRTLTIALVLALLPAMMIIEQPDLGTAILVATSGLFVLFFAGISWRFMRNSTIVVLAAAPLAWFSMHDYQRRRVLTLFDPGQDPLGAGYHIIQSTIAVGSGGTYGKGWLNGTQSHLEFLPERATDFIFAVYCEEFGLVGVVVMLIAYAMIIVRGVQIALDAQEMFSRLIAASLVLTLFIYLFVNMGMVTGQLPVVGVPLPMVSYGGTSLVTILAGFGILMSVQTHRKFIADT